MAYGVWPCDSRFLIRIDVGICSLQVSEALRQQKVNEENDKARKARAEWVRLKQLEDPQLTM